MPRDWFLGPCVFHLRSRGAPLRSGVLPRLSPVDNPPLRVLHPPLHKLLCRWLARRCRRRRRRRRRLFGVRCGRHGRDCRGVLTSCPHDHRMHVSGPSGELGAGRSTWIERWGPAGKETRQREQTRRFLREALRSAGALLGCRALPDTSPAVALRHPPTYYREEGQGNAHLCRRRPESS